MSNRATYQGILFPRRAEDVTHYRSYRVFLEHWDPIGKSLRSLYEALALRRETHALILHGGQGTGKTLFANTLKQDWQATFDAIGKSTFRPDAHNLWHRITGTASLDDELIRTATKSADVITIENNKDWVAKAIEVVQKRADRHCVVIADNAESAYFRQGLVNLSDLEFLSVGEKPEAYKMAAQKFVALARGDLRGCLFLILTNDQEFAEKFRDAVELQHAGMVTTEPLPSLAGAAKEQVIRINTNRLNEQSYWSCIDISGAKEKLDLRSAMFDKPGFPDAFQAVDLAAKSRVGRPANKNQLSLVILSKAIADPFADLADVGTLAHEEISHQWLGSRVYSGDWARLGLSDPREAKLLESEWNLRIMILGDSFVRALLSGDANFERVCFDLLDEMKASYSSGTQAKTRSAFETRLKGKVDAWPDVSGISVDAFWSKGQRRSMDYESVLKKHFANYSKGTPGFLRVLPDVALVDYVPCAVTAAATADVKAIRDAIIRDCHTLEFTACPQPKKNEVALYLQGKLSGYVSVTQEQ